MACSYLPEDIIANILKRLSVKCLCRFQCVSKPWLSLIRNPKFVSEHYHFFNGRPTSSSESILVTSQCAVCAVWHLSGDKLERYEHHKYFPFDYGIVLLGCCNGIVCASVEASYLRTDFLWNPATREYKTLPESSIKGSFGSICMHHVGFGFDPKNDDYKVLRIASFQGFDNRVEVYSMKTNSWREIQRLRNHLLPSLPDNPDCCINGVLFFKAYDENEGKNLVILLFDIGDEEFQEIDRPPSVRGSTILTKYNQTSIAVLDWNEGDIDIWVRDVGYKKCSISSWVKQFSISLPCWRSFHPLGFLSSGEIMCYTGECQLGSYNPVDQRLRSLDGGGVPRIGQFVCYKESLEPLGGDNVLNIEAGPEYMEYYAHRYDEEETDRFHSSCGCPAPNIEDEDVDNIQDVYDGDDEDIDNVEDVQDGGDEDIDDIEDVETVC